MHRIRGSVFWGPKIDLWSQNWSYLHSSTKAMQWRGPPCPKNYRKSQESVHMPAGRSTATCAKHLPQTLIRGCFRRHRRPRLYLGAGPPRRPHPQVPRISRPESPRIDAVRHTQSVASACHFETVVYIVCTYSLQLACAQKLCMISDCSMFRAVPVAAMGFATSRATSCTDSRSRTSNLR